MRGLFILVAALTAAGCASEERAPLHQRKDGALMRSRWRVPFVSMAPAGSREEPSPPVCEVFLAVDPQGVIASAQMRGDLERRAQKCARFCAKRRADSTT
jgi:hypothetical protein